MFPKRLRQMNVYTTIRTIHLWLAITLGGIFVLSGLTGSILVFDHALDETLNADLLLTDHPLRSEERLPYDVLWERAVVFAAAHNSKITGFTAPRHETSTQMFWMKSNDSKDTALNEVFLHPVSGEILGQRVWGDYFTSFLYVFHYTLWLGKNGKLLIGFTGIGCLLLLISGLYVWWPRGQGRHQWKAALTIKSKAGLLRRLFDLHRVAGIYGLLVLFVVVFTGVYMIFPESFRAVTPHTSPLLRAGALEQATTPQLTANQAFEIAKTALPESSFSRLYSGDGKQAWLMTFATPGDPKEDHGYSRLTLDPTNGQILDTRNWQTAPIGDRFFEWMMPLHNGSGLGWIGRALVCISGFLPLVLMITGIWRWLRKRRAKRVLRSK